MATIVTMDSNGSSSVLSPTKRRSYKNEHGPALVHGFYLDGTQPSKTMTSPTTDEASNSHSRGPEDDKQFEVLLNKTMSEERSAAGTGTTATTSDTDSFLTSERTNSSSTAKSENMNSPMMGTHRNAGVTNSTAAYSSNANAAKAGNLMESPRYSNHPVISSDRRGSNISFQDMYDDNNVDDNPDNDDDEDDDDGNTDFYSSQMSTPPTCCSETAANATTAPDSKPHALRASDCKGAPPTTLYALPEHTVNHFQNQYDPNQQYSAGQPECAVLSPNEESSARDTTTDGESIASSMASYSTAPAFPPDGSTPQNSIPQHRTVLYSAIGSLETCGAHSLKKMWTKPKQKGFSQFIDSSQLIAPASNQMKTSTKISNVYMTTQDRFGDSNGNGLKQSTTTAAAATEGNNNTSPANSNHSGASTQPTPTTSHHQAAFHFSLKSMQDKMEAVEQKNKRSNRATNRVSTTTSTSSTSALPAAPGSSSQAKQQTKSDGTKIASSMRKSKSGRGSGSASSSRKSKKSVKIDDASLQNKKRNKKPMEMFRPSCDAYTPRMERKKITYKPAEMRTPVQNMATTMGTLSRPNFRDALRRVAMLLRQHIVKIEQRFNSDARLGDEGLFKRSMMDAFSEEKFATPRYKCTVVRVPMARPGMVFGLKQIRPKYEIPSEEEIYEFAHQLFKTVQLSSECSIVCLIYIERLMEASKVPLLASTWRPIFMCGLLLASKVWQDLSSWNIELASVYPQFSLEAINRLELQFLRMVKWDLYISSR